MLSELAHALVTPATLEARRSGLLADKVSLWSRSRRFRAAWAPHKARSRAAVDRAIDAVTRRRTAVVLGSGLLDDVPIDRMASMFGKVVLVDAVHLAAVRLAVWRKGWRNVEFVTADLSGFDEALKRERFRRAVTGGEIGGRLDPLAFVRRMPEVDLVVSANLLSQLAFTPSRRAETVDPKFTVPPDVTRQLVAAHVYSLAGMSCRSVLVTDTDYVVVDREGNVIDEQDVLHGVTLPEETESWEWTVAPYGEESPDTARVHHVVAIDDVALDLA
ncbi:hypothetical protein [Chthonobacter rhizosphaerae]|uniref:hypothetical protein n=1 Tax=Chthonobacter rhizosphaerae TaxID=2735553 RepID=UPI0015EFC901|nr:hypothetical protein [Chthonobacter rhizosphaerae]